MTKQEELTYLFGILSEASKWSSSPDDNRDFVRLEVEERIRNLINGVVPESDNLPAEEENLTGSEHQALEAAKLNGYLLNNGHLPDPGKAAKAVSEWKSKRVRCQENAKERWKHGRVRVTIDGKPVWKLESDCHKEIIPGFEKKWHWVWNGSDGKKDQEQVNKLSDELWEAHENGAGGNF